MLKNQLITLAETLSAHTGLKLTTIGVYSVNDGKFLPRLKDGGGCTIATAERFIIWFDANWPLDLEWPTSIQRPSLLENRRAI